jgi:hypothetical protein
MLLPVILGTCYMTRAQVVTVGALTFDTVRILLGFVALRIVIRREWPQSRALVLDSLLIIWAVWLVLSVAFHDSADSQLTNRFRLAYEGLGLYFACRCFCRTGNDVAWLCQMITVAVVPLAACMALEKLIGFNLFSVFGGVTASPAIRSGLIRAQGPFAHPILAGTVGAAVLPLAVAVWRQSRAISISGIAGAAVMIASSGSSGPLISGAVGILALAAWHQRLHLRFWRWAAVTCYIGASLVTTRPAYFIVSRIDLTGGSTGYYRARLIQSAFEHIDEWWLFGTDITRHWMPTGLAISPDQADVTNHYIALGVLGGLPLMLLFILLLFSAFRRVGSAMSVATTNSDRFIAWCIGTSLTVHATACLSVTYFDHSILFLYFALAMTPALAKAAPTMPLHSPRPSQAGDARPRAPQAKPLRVRLPGGRGRRSNHRAVSSLHQLRVRLVDVAAATS